jgi:hypothetical protein
MANATALISAALTMGVLNHEPPISDLGRFPPPRYVERLRSFQAEYLEHLRARLSYQIHEREQILEAISETESLWAPWETLYDAQHAWSEDWIRHHLAYLRMQLGMEDYLEGRMPPPVPVWRFRRID